MKTLYNYIINDSIYRIIKICKSWWRFKTTCKKAYEYNLSKMTEFDGKLTDYKKVKDFLETNYEKQVL